MFKFINSTIHIQIISLLLLSSPLLAGNNSKVIPFSDVKWEALNPARGDQSPKAGTLWGDRMAAVPTGFLAEFATGFSSPAHIHNATYRAVVISGLIHNDDSDAAPMWMPAGSFWTQPKGEPHITAAKGERNIALVEIDQGPYLVKPIEDAFDDGERPINVDASNFVWVDFPEVTHSENGPKVAYLWGTLKSGQSRGIFIKLAADFKGEIQSEASTFHAVVISGLPAYIEHQEENTDDAAKALTPGSYFGSTGTATHRVSSSAREETIVYVRTNGEFKIKDSIQ